MCLYCTINVKIWISRFYFCFRFFLLVSLSFSRDDWMTVILLLLLLKWKIVINFVSIRMNYDRDRKWNVNKPKMLRHVKSTWIISLCWARRVSRSKRVARLTNFAPPYERLSFNCTLAALSGAFQSSFDSRVRTTDWNELQMEL